MNSSTTSKNTKEVHHGKNVKRLREIMDIKQAALGIEIGVSQQSMSRLENSHSINDKTLMDIANTLKITIGGIKNFDENKFIEIITEFLNGNDSHTSTIKANHKNYAFSSFDKETPLLKENLNKYDVSSKDEKDEITALIAEIKSHNESFRVFLKDFASFRETVLKFINKDRLREI